VGSQWFTVSVRAIRSVTTFLSDNPGYVAYYRRADIPDESFFHTILRNDPTLRFVGDNRRFIRFPPPPSEGHPLVLGVDDLDDMVASGSHFARKFDGRVDPVVLDLLDRRIRPSD
jgi:hypothetical protein